MFPAIKEIIVEIPYFWAAAGVATLWFSVHLFAGGREVARPLLAASDLAPVARDTQYLCWHFTSLAIACMAGFFAWAAASGETAFAVAGTILAAGFVLVGVSLVIGIQGRHIDLPQGWLFLPVAALGIAGLIL
jgi:hypothetical protein